MLSLIQALCSAFAGVSSLKLSINPVVCTLTQASDDSYPPEYSELTLLHLWVWAALRPCALGSCQAASNNAAQLLNRLFSLPELFFFPSYYPAHKLGSKATDTAQEIKIPFYLHSR